MAILNNKQFMAVGGAAAVLGVAAYFKGKRMLSTTLNPASDQNVIYRAVEGERLDSIGNAVFGTIDSINPFVSAERRAYGRSVRGYL